MTIGFALMLDPRTHNYIRQAQIDLNKKFDFRISRQYPHITIKSPFETEELEPFVNYLEQLAVSIKPFPVRLKGFGHFGERVLFLEVVENSILSKLHFRILEELGKKFGLEPHQFEGENIKFHASLAGYSSQEDFKIASAFLQNRELDHTFIARELGLFYHLGEGGWMVMRRIELMGG